MFEETLLDRVHRLQRGLVAEATGESFEGGDAEYIKLRKEIASSSTLKDVAPSFLRRCSGLEQFWGWIKYEKPTYAERRTLIWDAFAPLIERIEFSETSPIAKITNEKLRIHGEADVHAYWDKATNRVENDPEGAITMARTLLEATCKAILNDLEIDHSNKDDIPKLWAKCSEALNLSPSQHHETVFKTILGNCTSIVANISSLRNKLGDAHVDQPKPVKPKPRHAALAVNLAGTMATFITETWQAKSQ